MAKEVAKAVSSRKTASDIKKKLTQSKDKKAVEQVRAEGIDREVCEEDLWSVFDQHASVHYEHNARSQSEVSCVLCSVQPSN